MALRDPALAELIGNATRRAFVAIINLCRDEQVDALLLSGDLYDGEQTSMKTARFLADQIRRLHEAGIKTYVIRGNHDALSQITRELVFPENSVTLFGGRAGAILTERKPGQIQVAIHGISFAQKHAPESLLPRFKPPVEGAINIGLLHTSVAGSPGHDPYAPCDLVSLQQAGFRYWALGHIHKRTATGGPATVVMPGMPQGRDINEAGPKSVTLTTIGDDGSIFLEERLTSVAQFERIAVNLDCVADWQDMVNALGAAMGRVRDDVVSEHLVARIRLTGTTPLAWRLRRDADLLRTEAEGQAAALGNSWIDKVEVACQAPGNVVTGADPTQADPLEELRRLMGQVAQDDAYRAEILEIAEELRTQLPPESRSLFGADAESLAAVLAEAAHDGIDDVFARLKATTAAGAG